MLKCKKCSQEKSEGDFYLNKLARTRDKVCKECRCAEARARSQRKTPEQRREHNLQARYGITVQEYDAMLEQQGGGCYICDRTEHLCVDHCHTTGRVRGILCKSCNTAIGWMRELEGISRAFDYLQPHSEELAIKLKFD